MENKGKTILLFVILTVSIFTVTSIQMAYAAGTLTSAIVEPSNNLVGLSSHNVVGFTTGTTGMIKTVNMTFPSGFTTSSARLIMMSGMPLGNLTNGDHPGVLIISESSPVTVPAGTSIMIDMGNIVNAPLGSYKVKISTRDALNTLIDTGLSSTFGIIPIGNSMLGGGSVSTSKIGTGQVMTLNLANGAVVNSKIPNNAINGTQVMGNSLSDINISPIAAIALYKLGAGILPANVTVDTVNIADASIILSKMASNSVGTAQILNQNVTMDKLAVGAVGSIQIANGAVGSTQIANGAVGSTQIANGAVGSTQIGAGAVGSTQIANGAVGSTQIGAGAVGSTQIANGAVGSTQIGNGAVGSTQIGNGAVGSTQIANGAVGSTQIANGAVSSTQIANGTIRSVNMSPSFFKKVTLQDNSAGHALGWNPDHILMAFTILDSSVKSSSVVPITVTSGSLGQFVCGVYDIAPGASFSIRCTAPVLDNGTLSYVVIN